MDQKHEVISVQEWPKARLARGIADCLVRISGMNVHPRG